jgi:hypothetical protein
VPLNATTEPDLLRPGLLRPGVDFSFVLRGSMMVVLSLGSVAFGAVDAKFSHSLL